ncbi:hypothetical protein B1218_33435 [Pseudomonas ogarae]|nr:hypothetical protein B1218_33435 [Pseudomonas ogarae]
MGFGVEGRAAALLWAARAVVRAAMEGEGGGTRWVEPARQDREDGRKAVKKEGGWPEGGWNRPGDGERRNAGGEGGSRAGQCASIGGWQYTVLARV